MAKQEQLEILKQGVDVWNKWRDENPVDTRNANGLVIDFTKADLRKANLSDMNLSEVVMFEANLSGAILKRANLKGAMISDTYLSSVDLSEADLSGAFLDGANLTNAKFIKSCFSNAKVGGTIFRNSDLSQILGLETVIHRSPSILSMDTFGISKGKIPDAFLRGCGLSDIDIEYAKLSNPDFNNEEINKILYKIYDLRATQAVQISPLFISYSHGNGDFVDKLEKHLDAKGIRYWRDVHNAKAGRLEKQIDRAMRLNPTVLLILSENSLQSDWVEHEVRTARDLEKELKRDVLCPVALDDSWKNSPWAKRIMEQVMEYNILDFSAWNDDAEFNGTFNKLIDGLELFYK